MEKRSELQLLVYLLLCLQSCTFVYGSLEKDFVVAKGSSATLRCPIAFATDVQWRKLFDNPYSYNFTTYTDGLQINPNLPHVDRLRVVVNNTTGNYDLQIMNVSSFDEGVYNCSYIRNETFTILNVELYIEKPPTDLRFVSNASGTDLISVEGHLLTLMCVVQSGSPKESLVIVKDGLVVISGGPGHLNYSFVTNQSDHMSNIECIADSPILIKSLSTTVRILVKYIPRVTIIEGSTLTVTENKTLWLTCKADCYPDLNNISWSLLTDQGEYVLLEGKISLLVRKINRNQAGDYICHAKNEVGLGHANITVTVQYPPDVRVFPVMVRPPKKRFDCVPQGIPTLYTFLHWEHKSLFGEHIRFLASMDNGTLIFNSLSASESYQDDGIYACTVTNGVENLLGTRNQNGETSSAGISPPVFVKENSAVQYTTKGSPSILTFYIYSDPIIESMAQHGGSISKIYLIDRYDGLYIKKKIFWHIFHNKRIRVYGYMVNVETFQFTEADFGNYTIIAKNAYGNSNFKFEIKAATIPQMPVNINVNPAIHTATVTWMKEFNGGYQQQFYVEIRKRTEQRWVVHGPFDESTKNNQSRIVYGLESGSVYLVRMYSNNKLGDSNKTNTITTETKDVQSRTHFLPYILIGVGIVILLFVTNACNWYMQRRKKHRHRQQTHTNSLNAESAEVQYGPYDEIGLPRDEYLEVIGSISIPDGNSLHDAVGIFPENECVINNPQDSSSSSEASYDYDVPQDEGAGNLNPYNSLQTDPQSRCKNYTALRRSSTTRLKTVDSTEKSDDEYLFAT